MEIKKRLSDDISIYIDNNKLEESAEKIGSFLFNNSPNSNLIIRNRLKELGKRFYNIDSYINLYIEKLNL